MKFKVRRASLQSFDFFKQKKHTTTLQDLVVAKNVFHHFVWALQAQAKGLEPHYRTNTDSRQTCSGAEMCNGVEMKLHELYTSYARETHMHK